MNIEKFGKITLVCGDCMDFMKEVRDKEFDLAIVDPPYGLPKTSTHGRGKLKTRIINRNDIHRWDTPPDEAYFRELFRISENQIIWGGNYFPLPPARCVICWDKVQPWENFSQIELAWTSFDCPAKLFRFDNRTTKKIHPTEKPVKLYEWLLTRFAKEGDKILDTHGGSMSHAIAAHKLGYELTIIEKDEEYYESAKERLIEFQKELSLF